MKNKGMFWHQYHLGLVSWCASYWKRVWEIIIYKPKREWFRRFKRFRRIKGELPQELIDIAKRLTIDDFPTSKRFEELISKHRGIIKDLHAKECKNCPWDGHTIFPPLKRNKH